MTTQAVFISTFCPSCLCGEFLNSKLRQEPQVIPPIQPDIVDRVFQLCDPLGTHAEGEAAAPGRVVAAVAQYDRMDHARAHDFEPAAALAERTPLAGAEDAVHVDFDARLGEREIARSDASLSLGPE